MNLNLKQAYLTTFYFLETIYDKTKDNALGGLLGAMNPYVFSDSISADPAIWDDWKLCSKKITDSALLTTNETYQVMISFLEFYKEEFGFELGELITKLKKAPEDKNWIACVNRVQKN